MGENISRYKLPDGKLVEVRNSDGHYDQIDADLVTSSLPIYKECGLDSIDKPNWVIVVGITGEIEDMMALRKECRESGTLLVGMTRMGEHRLAYEMLRMPWVALAALEDENFNLLNYLNSLERISNCRQKSP